MNLSFRILVDSFSDLLYNQVMMCATTPALS